MRQTTFFPNAAQCAHVLASAGDDGRVMIWDPQTTKEIDRIPMSTAIRCVALSADGHYLAVGTRNGAVRVWDALKTKW